MDWQSNIGLCICHEPHEKNNTTREGKKRWTATCVTH